jgi:hypothetical protein
MKPVSKHLPLPITACFPCHECGRGQITPECVIELKNLSWQFEFNEVEEVDKKIFCSQLFLFNVGKIIVIFVIPNSNAYSSVMKMH